MSNLHPIVLEKLQRFNRQRRRLIVWRGVCSALAVWIAAMLTVALIDRFVLIPDGLRLALSVAGYVATAVVFWLECGRQLTRLPDARELARLVEIAAPQLREELLSAVELAETGQQTHWDSEEFRAALQAATARDVGAVQVEGLLTKRLIAGWLVAAGATLAVLLVLLGIPGLRFVHSFARAVAPSANLARYSDVQISVTPTDSVVPEGDSIPVIATISGADVQQVILETRRERTPMSLSSANQFTALIQVNQEPVQFRIRAKDAITQKFTLTPKPRPHVVRFQKTYRFPAYSKLPVKTVTEENGDLTALEGTEVELHLEVDQPIKEAALVLEKQKLPLDNLTVRIPLTASSIYRVHLVAAQTGFENKFSPQYEIRVQPDLIPFAKIDKPDKDELVLPPDTVVNLAGSAKDDLALARVDQAIQINRGPWQTIPLAPAGTNEIKVARAWDLFELGLHPGDRILTKLVAVDLKGQRGESAPVRIRIATDGFDPDRLKHLQERQALNKVIREFREAAELLDAKTREARAVINDPIQKKQATLAAQTAAEAADRKADEALQEIKAALPRSLTDREAADLALVGTGISRAKNDGIEPVKTMLETGDNKVLEPLATGTTLARAADDAHRQTLAAAEAAALAQDLQQLAAEQRTATNEFAQAERAARRQAVVALETKAVEEQLKTLAEHAGGGPGNTARNLERDLNRNRESLEKTLAADPTAETLRPPAEQLQRSVANAATAMTNAGRELEQRADTARRNLQDQTGTAADALARAKPETLPSVADQLKDRAALEELRPDADAPFVAALGNTADALTNTNAAKALEPALRKLEAGHALAEQADNVRQLAAQERWEKPVTSGEWQTQQQQLQALPQQLNRAQLPAETKRAVEEALRNAQPVNAEMAQRPATTRDMAEPLEKLAGALEQAQQQLQPVLDQARAEINKQAPALSERLAKLAEATPQTPQFDQQREAAKNALRRDANAQDLATEEGRARARDADDAGALLRPAVPKPDDLKLLAEHYKNLETGKPEATRAALREAEKELGLKPTLDAEYAKAAALEKLAALPPEQQLAELEKALASSPPMQRELSDIAEKTLKSAATDLQQAAAKEQQIARQPLIDQAKRIADEAQKLARQDVPAIAKQAGETAKPELNNAGQKLANAAQNIPRDATPPAEQLAQAMQNQVAPLQQAANDLKAAAEKLNPATVPQAQQAAQKAEQLAKDTGQIAAALNPSLPAKLAKDIAEAAKKLAQQDVPAIAAKAGEAAKPDLAKAGEQLEKVAHDVPDAAAKSPGELAKTMQEQVGPLQEAAKTLGDAAAKASQPAQAQAQQAAQQAAQLAQQAKQLADTSNNAANPLPSSGTPKPTAEQAKQIAAEAQKLARQDIPALAQQANPVTKPELTGAAQKLDAAAQNIPQDFSKLPEQLVPQMQGQVAQLQQAAKELSQAAAKLEPFTQAAQQKAEAAAQAAQQARANNAGEPAIKQADAAAQQAQVAAQQAQAAQAQAQQVSQQAGQLAAKAGQLAEALQQAKPLMQAAVQQPAIEQAVREAGKDIERAGRHEARLGQEQTGQELQQLGQQVDQQTGGQLAQAAQAMAQAESPAQIPPAAEAARAAIQSPLEQLNAALQQATPPAQASPAAPNALANVPEEAAQWMARALDSLDAGQQPPAARAAQAQAGAMMAARSQNLVPGEQPLPQGASAGGGGRMGGEQPEMKPLPDSKAAGGAWGKLPAKLARDLLDSQREGVHGEYREMVEVYFRAIAEKAKEEKP